MRVLDLFAGIGGFTLGLERAGFETVAFCEIEPYCQKVLAKHWPEVPIYDDVKALTNERLIADGITNIEVITGGFPCQDISVAGKKAGIKAETRSGLWSEIVRLAGEIRPRYIVVENVANLLSGPIEKRGGWFGRVLGDLAECGYDAEWENIPAPTVGAPHLRKRVCIVAYSTSVGLSSSSQHIWKYFEKPKIDPTTWQGRRVAEPEIQRVVNGLPNQLDQLRGLGNAFVPQIAEMIGRAIMVSEATA